MSIKGNIRLQFLHHSADTFNSRGDAISYLGSLVSTASSSFLGESLEGEPIAVKYSDASRNTQLILAIGTSGETGEKVSGITYHYIDTALLQENIDLEANTRKTNDDSISGATSALSGSVIELSAATIAATVKSSANTINVTPTTAGTNLEVNIDKITLSADTTTGVISSTLKISAITTGLSSDVKEEFVLVDGIGNEVGPHIKVYNDWHIFSAGTDHENCAFVDDDDPSTWCTSATNYNYKTAYFLYFDGDAKKYKTFTIDLRGYIRGDKISSGLTWNTDSSNPQGLAVKIDTNSESYLTVGTDGLKLSGINDAIKVETDRATAAENSISGSVDTEVSRAKAAETSISGGVDTLRTNTENSADTLNNAITAETATRQAQDALIWDELNSNQVKRSDGTIIITPPPTTAKSQGTLIQVNVDNATIVSSGALSAISTTLEISGYSGSTSLIREEYSLVDKNGVTYGDSIKIYNDSALIKAYLGHTDDKLDDPTSPIITTGTGATALCFLYQLKDTTYNLVCIDVSLFIQYATFKDGLISDANKVVKVLPDPASDKYLSVSTSGVKVAGIESALTALEGRAIGSGNTLSGLVLTEETRAMSAETALGTRIDNEATARQNQDTLLNNAITAETKSRQDADTTLQTNIDNEATARSTDDTRLYNALTGETQNRQSADTMIYSAITVEYERAKSREDQIISGVTSLAQSAAASDDSLNTKITGLSGTVMTLSGNLYDDVLNNLSIKHIVTEVMEAPTATSVNNSLLRTFGGKIYASSSDADMVHGSKNLYNVIENLLSALTAAQAEITSLKNFINDSTGLTKTIKEKAIEAVTVTGTSKEISVTSTTTTTPSINYTVGFDTNAIFGPVTP